MTITRRHKTVDPSDLTPHPRNTRVHREQQLADLGKSLKRFGIIRPIVVDETMTVLAGHGVRLAAIKEGIDRVPVVIVSGLTDDQKRAYIIADNRLAEMSRWDYELLDLELGELGETFDLSELGWSEWRAPKTTSGGREIDDDELSGNCTCPRCGFEFDAGSVDAGGESEAA